MDIILKYVTHSLEGIPATPLFSHINLSLHKAIFELFQTASNATATLVYYSIMQYTFFVLKHCLTTVHYCAIMLIFSPFKMPPNIAVIVTGLQSGWLRNHHPVLARNKEILQNVLTGSGAHLASYWAPRALSLGLKWPGHEADSSNPSTAII